MRAGTDTPDALRDWPVWVGHRGAGRTAPENHGAPENTLAALDVAAAAGFLAVEVDVQLSADGVPVILHDDTLERTTGRRERADALTARVLTGLRADQGFDGPILAGAHECAIPDLPAALARCRARGLRINLELKGESAGAARLVGAVAGFLAAMPAGWASAHVLISSFDAGLVGSARDALPGIPRALLCERVRPDDLALAAQLGCSALNVGELACTPPVIAAAGRLGMVVMAWTVNDAARARALLDAGVRAVITDRLEFAGRYSGWRAEPRC